jgi:hypothetical protein
MWSLAECPNQRRRTIMNPAPEGLNALINSQYNSYKVAKCIFMCLLRIEVNSSIVFRFNKPEQCIKILLMHCDKEYHTFCALYQSPEKMIF